MTMESTACADQLRQLVHSLVPMEMKVRTTGCLVADEDVGLH